jgi:exosortase/archaeosortase family protein
MIFSGALHDESMSHVLIIPFMIAYLVYRKRKVIEATAHFKDGRKLFSLIPVDAFAGGLLLLTSLGIYLHASHTMMSIEYRVLALIVFVASCILILFNSYVLRQFIFPLLLLALLFPPAEILYNTGSALSVASSTITYSVLKAVGYPVSLNTTYENPWLRIIRQNGTPVSFSVDPACSGVYSLMGFLVFALFIVYLVRGSLWKKAVAFSIGFPLIYSLNITRLITIVLVGYYYGGTIAVDLFHVFGGWILVFAGSLMLLVLFRRVFNVDLGSKPLGRWEKCEKAPLPTKSDFCFGCGRLLTSSAIKLNKHDLARVLVVVISVVLIIAVQTPIFLEKGPVELVVNTARGPEFSTNILPQMNGYSLAYVYRDREFEAVAKQDLSLIYSYVPENETEDVIWVSVEIASIRSSLHRTEACLVKWFAAGEKVEEFMLRDYQLLENPPTLGRFCVLNYTRSRTVRSVIYWFQTSILSINSTIVEKYVKISLVIYLKSLDNISQSESRILAFAKSVTGYWQPIQQWSQVALVLSKGRYVLLLLPPFLLVGMVLYVLFQRRMEAEADAQAYHKLPNHYKQIVSAICETQRSKIPTFNNIWSAYRKFTGQPIEREEFYDQLLAVEKTEVIECGVFNVDDQPVRVWRTRVDFKY